MRLNEECCRDVLLYLVEHLGLETSQPERYKVFQKIDVRNMYDVLPYSSDDIFYSANKLAECGYIIIQPHELSHGVINYYIIDITYRGHQFIEATRDKTIWEQTKGVVAQVGNHALHFIEDTAQKIAVETAKALVVKAVAGT